ncbi:MAG: glycosyltransferase [Candidatus Sungbacteria bacterium]|nr:glycosyltransferase [Candidatus Sungbacteria bacterium]
MASALPGKKIIAVLPAYHAVKTLTRTVEAIPKDWVDEIILVDDASSDNTAGLARSLGITTVIHQKNTGYGGNQKTCYQEAMSRGADIVIMVHPDFQYDPSFIPQLVSPIAAGEADACFGSRMIMKGDALRGGMPWWKFVANIGLTALENFILGLGLTEYHSGFRAYSREVLSILPLQKNADGFVFDSEIIVQLGIAGFSIKEIPITTRYFKEASMIGFWKSVRYGFSILLLMEHYLLHRKGFYTDPRFVISRHPCPVCAGKDTPLLYPRSTEFMGLAAYRITENTVGAHDNIFLCHACGSAFSRSGHKPLSLVDYYTSQPCDPAYLAEEKGRRKSFRRIIKRIETHITKGAILEVGSGPGFFLAEAKERGWKTSGIELSRQSADFARSRLGLDVKEGDASLLSTFPDNTLDAVAALDVVEHLAEPLVFLKEVRRVLKPGGLFVWTTPRFDSWLRRILGRRWYAILPSHLVYFSRKGIIIAARATGFTLKESRSFTRYFSPAYVIFRLKGYISGSNRSSKKSGPPLGARSDLETRREARPVGGLLIPLQLFDEFELYFEKPIK